MALTLIAVWFLIEETHRGQQWTPALTLPQVRYGLSVLLLEVCCPPGIDFICRHVHRQLMRNELARSANPHHPTCNCVILVCRYNLLCKGGDYATLVPS